MPTSIELRQERARIVDSMRAITEVAETANRNLDAAETESYNRGAGDFAALGERITRAEALEAADAENARSITRGAIPGEPGGRPDNDGQGDQTPEQRKAMKRSAFLEALRSRTMDRMTPERRALVENTAGEILVPEDLETEILRALPGLTVIRGLASQRSITSNRVRRRSLGEAAVGWGALETVEQTLTDSMPSTPTEKYTYIEDLYGLAKIGEDELDDTDVNLEAFVQDSFGFAIGTAEDTAFAVGVGHASNTPVGLFSVAGAVTALTSSATTYAGTVLNAPGVLVDDLKKLIYAVDARYRPNGTFLMKSATELFASSIKDGQGRYLWEPNTQAGRPSTFLGYPIVNQEDIAAIGTGNQIAMFGDFKQGYKVYDRLGLTLQRLNELYAITGFIGFKVRFRVGGDVIQPNALKILKLA